MTCKVICRALPHLGTALVCTENRYLSACSGGPGREQGEAGAAGGPQRPSAGVLHYQRAEGDDQTAWM